MSGPAQAVAGLVKGRVRISITRFSAEYWKFYAGAFCFDFGFGLFFFLFTLYLADLHFDERAIGRIVACVTLGNILGTLPATMLARKYGLHRLLLIVFLAAPVFCALRVAAAGEYGQMILALGAGVALCGWPICFSPTLAALTDEGSRARGFSIAFATGIGLGSVAGLAAGYIPEWLERSPLHLPLLSGIRAVLLAACAAAIAGVIPILRLKLTDPTVTQKRGVFHPYLWRFLPAFLLWNVVTGSFPVFGAVYLQKSLGMPLGKLGTVFAVSQLAQFAAVLGAPALSKRVGVGEGIALAQVGAACCLALVALSPSLPLAVCLYVAYFAAQFMCGPGIYQLLMDSIPEGDRSTASAVQNLTGALCQAGTAAITGAAIVRFGYHVVMLGDAAIALLSAACFVSLVRFRPRYASSTGLQTVHTRAQMRGQAAE